MNRKQADDTDHMTSTTTADHMTLTSTADQVTSYSVTVNDDDSISTHTGVQADITEAVSYATGPDGDEEEVVELGKVISVGTVQRICRESAQEGFGRCETRIPTFRRGACEGVGESTNQNAGSTREEAMSHVPSVVPARKISYTRAPGACTVLADVNDDREDEGAANDVIVQSTPEEQVLHNSLL